MKFYRENQINPAASCLPMLAQFPVFIALYYALRELLARAGVAASGQPLVPPLHPVDRRPHDVALGRLRAARRLRRVARWRRRSTCRRPSTRRSAHLHAHAARLRVRDRALPGGPRSLLGDDEPLDGRSGADHAATRAEDAGAGSSRRRARGRRRSDDGASGNGAKQRARPRRSPRRQRSQQPPRKVRRKKKAGGGGERAS